MLNIARRARDAMDSAEDEGKGLYWDRANFDALSAAVDKLDELPDDDQPGYVMGPVAIAAWALSKTAHPETWKAVPSQTAQDSAILRAAALEEAAVECERLVVGPFEWSRTPAHSNVWDAAKAIRGLAPTDELNQEAKELHEHVSRSS